MDRYLPEPRSLVVATSSSAGLEKVIAELLDLMKKGEHNGKCA